jgi:peptidoglycan/xylan/chitin deacetylase (PgdA/CDA1 family)
VKDWIGTGSYCTEAQLLTLHAAGWNLANHTTSHTDLTTLNEEQIISEISECEAYLYSLGFGSGARHLAYPYGAVNAAVYDAIKPLVKTARTVLQPFSGQAFIEEYDDLPWYIKAFAVIDTTPVATLTTAIDQVIEDCGLIVLLFHIIADSPGGTYEYATDNFQAVSNYLKTKSDAALLSVMTVEEYWKTFAPPTFRSRRVGPVRKMWKRR